MKSSSASPLLKFENVGKSFGRVQAVQDLDLEVGRGEFVAIMGPSGCGKTTTLRMLAGLENPTQGRILYNSEPINQIPPWQRQMPLVWQSYALFPFLSVLDNAAFGLKSRKVPKAERRRKAQDWLDRLGIGQMANRMPDTLSGGQAQRVALARALVLEPEILILDEPLSALDAHMVVRMQTELAELQRTLGITFVYVTHNQSEAFAMADQVVIMNEGLIEQMGAPLEIYRAPQTKFVAQFVGTNNIIDGRLTSVSGEDHVMETALGPLKSTNPTGAKLDLGNRVSAVVSADVMLIDAPDMAGANCLKARLVGESFAGTVVTLVFEAQGGLELKVQLQHRALRTLNLSRDQPATLSFDPAETSLIGISHT